MKAPAYSGLVTTLNTPKRKFLSSSNVKKGHLLRGRKASPERGHSQGHLAWSAKSGHPYSRSGCGRVPPSSRKGARGSRAGQVCQDRQRDGEGGREPRGAEDVPLQAGPCRGATR